MSRRSRLCWSVVVEEFGSGACVGGRQARRGAGWVVPSNNGNYQKKTEGTHVAAPAPKDSTLAVIMKLDIIIQKSLKYMIFRESTQLIALSPHCPTSLRLSKICPPSTVDLPALLTLIIPSATKSSTREKIMPSQPFAAMKSTVTGSTSVWFVMLEK